MLRGFTKKKVNSLTLGEQLKKLRAEGRVSLHEVSRETKIPVKYLVMIEEGDYKNLPPDVYVKGFLRSYAEFLGVDCRKDDCGHFEKKPGASFRRDAQDDNGGSDFACCRWRVLLSLSRNRPLCRLTEAGCGRAGGRRFN
jgi:transcriptional regulator with XRE-family HTH domain